MYNIFSFISLRPIKSMASMSGRKGKINWKSSTWQRRHWLTDWLTEFHFAHVRAINVDQNNFHRLLCVTQHCTNDKLILVLSAIDYCGKMKEKQKMEEKKNETIPMIQSDLWFQKIAEKNRSKMERKKMLRLHTILYLVSLKNRISLGFWRQIDAADLFFFVDLCACARSVSGSQSLLLK